MAPWSSVSLMRFSACLGSASFEALTGPRDNPVEHKALVIVLLAGAKSGSNGELVLRPQLRLQALELGPRPREVKSSPCTLTMI